MRSIMSIIGILALGGCGMLTGLQTGAQGQAPESAVGTATAQPLIVYFNLFGESVVKVSKDEEGNVVAEATTKGGSNITGATFSAPTMDFGTDSFCNDLSTGGGNTGGTQPGQGGDIAIPITPTPAVP